MNEGRRRDDSLNFLQRNWAIIATIATLLISYATLTANYTNLETRVCKTEAKVETVAEMKTDIGWIKKSLARIEDRLK